VFLSSPLIAGVPVPKFLAVFWLNGLTGPLVSLVRMGGLTFFVVHMLPSETLES
jgi:hypothetical protein